jgi:FMN phosphatase YigB (HAD superfamily)
MDKIILTDADGCLVDWNAGFNKFMDKRGMPQLPNTDDKYLLSLRHGISSSLATELVTEFNEGPCIENLEPFADAVKYVKKLADKGFRFIVVTSISDAPQAKVFRTRNLTAIFGDVFDEINCIEMGASKAHILKNWQDTGYFWIEDHMRQAEAGYEAGLRTALISHPYNSHYKTDLFPTVSYKSPWEEIYNMVCKEYNL